MFNCMEMTDDEVNYVLKVYDETDDCLKRRIVATLIAFRFSVGDALKRYDTHDVTIAELVAEIRKALK